MHILETRGHAIIPTVYFQYNPFLIISHLFIVHRKVDFYIKVEWKTVIPSLNLFCSVKQK